jgi:YVTN family beta-propeller protein
MRNVRPLLVTSLTSLAIVGALGCEPEVSPQPSSSPQTSRLGISADGKTLYVAHADHDLVRAIDALSGDVVGEVTVAGHPHRLTVLEDGRVAVTSRYAGTVSIVNVERESVDATVDVGSDPFGVIENDGALLVAVAGEGDLAKVSLDGRLLARVPLAHDDPRGLARTDDGKVIVSHFTAGKLSVVVNDEARNGVDMRLPSKRFFFPTQMDTLSVSSGGTEIAVPHVECNNDPAQFGAGGTDLAGSGVTVEYYVTGPTGFPAVVPAVSTIDPVGEELLSDEVRTIEEATLATSERAGAAAPVINPIDRNLLGNTNVAQPAAVAWVGGDELQLVVNRGSGNVIVRRPVINDGQSSIIAAIPIGDGPGADSIQVAPDGRTAYVFNAFDDTIYTFAIPLARVPKSRFEGDNGSGQAFVARAEPLDTSIESSALASIAPVLPRAVRNGRELFHTVDDRVTRMGSISCASCHPGGGDDGTTWSFAEGPRQSPALWGGILGTEPFHWDQAVVDMADISRVTIQGRMGGFGLERDDMNDIGAFLDTIPAPAPPRNADLASIARGEAIFFDAAVGCAECHSGASFTDNRAHNVGTGTGFAARESATTFATPVLTGLAHSAPYLHDGSAQTLEELIEILVVTDRMGRGASLDAQGKADLVAFLKTL